jgi:hypothetical protein
MSKRIVVVIPHSHTWFWSQTCVAALLRNPPNADGHEINVVLVDNSPWSPAMQGILDTSLLEAKPPLIRFDVITNPKGNKFHASALDCVVDRYDFDYLLTMETDVLALRPTWLQWFVDQVRPTDYAVGAWHHEQFVNPSCTLYRGTALREMAAWCQCNQEPNLLRWGPMFEKTQLISDRLPERDYKEWYDQNIEWIAGPFAEKRGWPVGTVLKEQPTGQMKGVSWYEPGQQLYHWAVEAGYTYTVCPTSTYYRREGMPVQTLYGGDPATREIPPELYMTSDGPNAQAVHLWGGTRALDIIKHDVTCSFVKENTPYWLEREARLWRETVPADVRAQTLDLMRRAEAETGSAFHITGQGHDHVTQRDKDAAQFVRSCYRAGGVEW